ncbi:MAG: RNA methyltransferase [Elusimicrobiales bacterium]|nr:RNA methyltransferase [Elusimicrobiales bacterium]
MTPLSLKIVLVRPRNPLNIGAAARAMANFGFDRLAVVNPYAPVWRETRAAVEAEDIVLNAQVFPTLAQAVADCRLVLGTTCGKKRALDKETVPLPDIAGFLKKRTRGGAAQIAVVFGPEKTGLSREHLELCHAFLTVPTSARTPSMNLAQAVAVCCYEFSKMIDFAQVSLKAVKSELPTAAETEAVAAELDRLLQKTGIQNGIPPAMRLANARNLLLKLPLSRAELFYIRAIIKKL